MWFCFSKKLVLKSADNKKHEILPGRKDFDFDPLQMKSGPIRSLVKSMYQKFDFLIYQPKHMLLVLKRNVSLRWLFLAHKTCAKTDGQGNIYTFMLKNFAYQNI